MYLQHCSVVTWLVPHETSAISAYSVYTIQPCVCVLCRRREWEEWMPLYRAQTRTLWCQWAVLSSLVLTRPSLNSLAKPTQVHYWQVIAFFKGSFVTVMITSVPDELICLFQIVKLVPHHLKHPAIYSLWCTLVILPFLKVWADENGLCPMGLGNCGVLDKNFPICTFLLLFLSPQTHTQKNRTQILFRVFQIHKRLVVQDFILTKRLSFQLNGVARTACMHLQLLRVSFHWKIQQHHAMYQVQCRNIQTKRLLF